MKILFVNPDSPDTFWGLNNSLKYVSKKAALPPLGLLTVAAMLPDTWTKKLVDIAAEKLTDKDILWADYVFVTAMAIQKKSLQTVIDRCKQLDAKIVLGGPHVTTSPELYDDVDHLILNEAEITLPEFLEDLQNGNPKHIYTSDKRADINQTPLPLWDLIDVNKYAVMSLQWSRGCPFNCDFCNVTTLFGHRIRTKSTDRILNELESIYHAGWTGNVFFVDDNFIAKRKTLKHDLLPAITDWMQKKDYPFNFNTQCSIDLSDDDELMQQMAQAGFDCVFIGIETLSQESFIECNKVQNENRNLVDCVKKIQNRGMQVQAGFILGFDTDQETIFEDIIQFIQNTGIVVAMVGLLNAPRGTHLRQRLIKEKRLLSDTSGCNTDFSMNFIPKMKPADLQKGYRKIVETIYSNKCYYQRIMTLFKNYKPMQKTGTKITVNEIKALLKSVWYIGILSKDRVCYWKQIFWSIRQPQFFHLTIMLAIYGVHFHKIYNP